MTTTELLGAVLGCGGGGAHWHASSLCARIRLEVGDSSVSFATVTPFLSNFVIRGPFLMGRNMFCSKQAILMTLCFPGGGEGVECSAQLSKPQSAVNRGDTGLGRW